jgi:hypothetical protein
MDGSDCLAERFRIASETHRFDIHHITLSYQRPKLLRTSGGVTRCQGAGFLLNAALKTRASATDEMVARRSDARGFAHPTVRQGMM